MHTPAHSQSIITDLMYQIITYVEKSHEPYKVITLPFYIQLYQYPVTLHLDLAIVRYPEKITTLQIDSLPLFIADISTCKTQHTDRAAKLKLYKNLGIREYWVIDWPHRRLCTYILTNKKNWSVRRYQIPCKISTFVLPMLELSLNFD